jgi:hypothetical protein
VRHHPKRRPSILIGTTDDVIAAYEDFHALGAPIRTGQAGRQASRALPKSSDDD